MKAKTLFSWCYQLFASGDEECGLQGLVLMPEELEPWYCLWAGFAGTLERRNQLMCLSPCSHEEWNQMQSQEDEVAITEQDLELIKERETAIRQLEVRTRSCFLSDSYL